MSIFIVCVCACACTKSLQLCLTLCDPMDCSPPGSTANGFSRQEYWSGLPCPPLREDPGIKLASLLSPALADGLFKTHATWEAQPYSLYKVK